VGAGYFKPQTVLLRCRGLRGGGSISGDCQTHGNRSSLRRTWVRLASRKASGRGESLFSRESGYSKKSKKPVTVVLERVDLAGRYPKVAGSTQPTPRNGVRIVQWLCLPMGTSNKSRVQVYIWRIKGSFRALRHHWGNERRKVFLRHREGESAESNYVGTRHCETRPACCAGSQTETVFYDQS
jgi:hypothetical protein